MDDLKGLADEDLRLRLRALAADERGLLVALLRHLAEWDSRDACLKAGFSSLYDYCRRELLYSEDEAVQRIIVARAAVKFTRMFTMLGSGGLSLCAAAAIAPHIKEANCSAVLDMAEGMSVREARTWAATQSPQKDRPDLIRPLGPGRNLFSFSGSDSLLRKVERGKELLWHKFPDGRLEHILEQAMDDMLQKRDPALKAAVRAEAEAGGHGRYVPLSMRLEVWRRDEGRCAFAADDGRRCAEKSGLEYDHIRPYAMGGATDADNLRLLCRAHNQLRAREDFGDAARRHLRH